MSTFQVLICGWSYRTTFNNELWTSMPPLYSLPLYSMKPSLRNLFMKKLTRDRVVPIIPFAPNRLLNVKDRLEGGPYAQRQAPTTHRQTRTMDLALCPPWGIGTLRTRRGGASW